MYPECLKLIPSKQVTNVNDSRLSDFDSSDDKDKETGDCIVE